jgi:hypothetical protein
VENLALDFQIWLQDNQQLPSDDSTNDVDLLVPEGVWNFSAWLLEHNMTDSSSRVTLKPDKKDPNWVSPLEGAPEVSPIPLAIRRRYTNGVLGIPQVLQGNGALDWQHD